ncbi:hypothetical protein [Streptomyces shenzhenensis]|uniref:hypothetical protein n=1 Tax=Streptomyces shenzhenensis TaxID=943815 RepID=UPI001F344900|nr:hypothetical protein [Streptomyces shenzhenensis]
MSEILSYLAVVLPADVSADAKLLALQCALRMNTHMRVTLSAGILRSLRINAVAACHELEQARWLSTVDGPGAAGFAADLRDTTLLAQSPARPGRRRAADWALRSGCPASAGTAEPLLRLQAIYVMAHSDPSSQEGVSECDRIIRDCAMVDHGLRGALNRLTATGILAEWQIWPVSGDVSWTLAPRHG